ncbi:EcsC family protein [Kineococcus endophyticus]|uniref:EcsC family protein n=1 Tax=Kineococcus endophyticus TaxID=1181883 RepID=A0ABV3PCY4_9ACTN
MSGATEAEEPATGLARVGQGLVEQLLRLGMDGFGPFKSAQESALGALEGRTREQAVARLIRNHCLVAGSQGAVTSLGGFIVMPATLPANLGASYLIQTHLAASIAHVYGHDLKSEEVRTAVLMCLLGNAGTEVLKQVGITVSTKYTMTIIKRIPIRVIRKVNKKVGFYLVAKYGTTRAVVTLGKGVPLVGAAVGGTIDAVATKAVGSFSCSFFDGVGEESREVRKS